MSKVVTNGIEFGNVPNAGANVLDWYEEGTWSPTFHGTGGSMGNTVVAAAYTRIGRIVTLHASAHLGSTWSAGTGGILVPPPFATTSPNFAGIFAIFDTSGNSYHSYMWRPSDGVIFKMSSDGSAVAALTVTQPYVQVTGDYFAFNATYQIV